MKRNKHKTIMIWALALLPLAATAVVYGFLPDEVPMRWGLDGSVSYSEKSFIWIIACLGVVMAALFSILPLIDPRGQNYSRFMEYYETFTVVVVAFFGILTGVMISESLNPGAISMGRILILMVGLLFLFIGNLLPKLKNNFFIGIRTPWTLSDPDIWNRTHRIGGRIYFIFGLCTALWALMPLWPLLIYIVAGVGLVSITVVPYLYSYFCYRQKKKKTAALPGQEEGDDTP